jgi:hypothetical protein
MTQKEKVLNAFMNGEQLSAKQISARFNAANPTAVVNTLRQEGYPIYLNGGGRDSRGRVRSSKYRLGTASRAVIAAGYKAIAQGLV